MAKIVQDEVSTSKLLLRIEILEELLATYEETALDQADELRRRLRQLELQTTLLLSQGEASSDGMLSLSLDGRVLCVNSRFAKMWHVESPPIGGKYYSDMVDAIASQVRDPLSLLETFRKMRADEHRAFEFELAGGGRRSCITAPLRGVRGGLLGRLWSYRECPAAGGS